MENNKNIIGLNMSIDEDVIRKTVSDAIKVALVSAIGDPEEILKKVVWATMDKYVDSDGRSCQKTSYNARPYLEYLTEKIIHEAVRECIKELVEENREKLAARYIETILSAAESAWKMPIEITFKQNR